jgi:Cu/Zn superoxide dismutase
MGGRLLGSFLTYGTSIEGLMETIKAESPAMFEKMKAHYFESKENLAKSVSGDLKKAAKVETGIKSEGSSSGLPGWVAVGLDILGAGMIGFGVYQNSQAASHKKDYKNIPFGSPQSDFDSAYEKVESSRVMRNTGYIAGGILLLGGVGLHIFF